ncbi:MAG: acyl-CoA synthetase (AMP-forming)/AMP-acid ligase II [Planctomycetota bacterium]|jgi:acyl-CoA synthetase (AMP-forming)/AMP-acid ligase II
MSLMTWFEAIADEVPDRPFIFFEDQVLSYADIKTRAWRIGSALQGLNVSGERVVTMLPNDPELLAVQFGILHAGGITVPLMSDGTSEEMRFFIDDTNPAVVISTEERWREVKDLIASLPQTVILTDIKKSWEEPEGQIKSLTDVEASGEARDPVQVPNDEPMAIMYTSGSTARPKGVILDAASFIKDADVQRERFALKDGENVLGVLPLFHIAGWHQCLGIALGCRGGMMMQNRFSVSRFWEEIDRTKTVGGLMMPAMISFLVSSPEQDDDADHSLRFVLSHWSDSEFERRFNAEIIPVWGQSELGGLATSGRVGEKLPTADCVGWPVPGLVFEIRDEEGNTLTTGQAGEICVKSPWVMKGYWGDKKLSDSVLENGWVKTGDKGSLDEEGRLYYGGRLKGMIKRAGENISAREVESVIALHPAVAECVCFGVPDPLRTEEVKVIVVRRPDAKITFEALIEVCSERLARFKIPRYWEFRKELPRTPSMKVAIQELKNDHQTMTGWDRAEEVDSS